MAFGAVGSCCSSHWGNGLHLGSWSLIKLCGSCLSALSPLQLGALMREVYDYRAGSRNWNGVGCGKVLGMQNLGSGAVSPIGRSLTSSGWSGLCLSGRNPLGFESGLSSMACKLLGRCGQREGSWGTEFHISVLNICAQNIRKFKLQLKSHIDPHILIVGGFNIQPLPKQVTQTKTKQKFSLKCWS